MGRVSFYIVFLCVSVALFSTASAQGCDALSDTTEIETLIADNLRGGDGGGGITVSLSRFSTVCLASSGERNKYWFISIVAEYDQMNPMMTGRIFQFEFSCRTGSWSATDGASVLGSTPANNREDVSATHLDTALRTNCSACVNPDNPNTGTFNINPDGDNHCAACSGCDDPQLCYVANLVNPPFVPTCCNYYDENGMCVETCPATSSVRAGDRDCLPECPSGQYNVSGVCENCTIDCVRGSIADDRNDCRCDCPQLYSGNDCSVCRCENGGTCGSNPTQCECPPRYSGALCDTCDITCSNMGTKDVDSCMCMCVEGVTGDSCENVNCGSNCVSCRVEGNGVVCTQCAEGYILSDGVCVECSCQNGATCTDTGTCLCTPGFTGADCSSVVCSCQNGATCTDTGTCLCPPGFTGADCSTETPQSCPDGQYYSITETQCVNCSIANCKECNDNDGDGKVECVLCEDGYDLDAETGECKETPTAKPVACGGGCIAGAIIGAVVGAALLAGAAALIAYGIYSATAAASPATNLAQAGVQGMNGVAKDNPIYVDPDVVL